MDLILTLLSLEFRDFKACNDTQPPLFDPMAPAAIDHFWVCMGEIKSVADYF